MTFLITDIENWKMWRMDHFGATTYDQIVKMWNNAIDKSLLLSIVLINLANFLIKFVILD